MTITKKTQRIKDWLSEPVDITPIIRPVRNNAKFIKYLIKIGVSKVTDAIQDVVDLRTHILELDDQQKETITVPEWNNIKLLLVGMNGTERAKYLERFRREDGTINYQALYPHLVIACTHDPETGERVFKDSDADAVNLKSGAALERIASKALKLSGMDQESEAEAGEDSSTESGGSTTS